MAAFFTGLKRRIFLSGRSESVYFGSLRENEIVGAIANAVASNVAKLTPQVIRKTAAGVTIKNDKLSRLLEIRPNAENSTYDFLYKMASDLVYTSNAFAVVFFNDDFSEITSIQPITATSHRIFEVDGVLYFKFVWEYDKKSYTVPYQFVIHIKGRYNRKRFLGTPPDAELQNSTELLGVTYNGIKNVIKNSASLRGYLKYNNFADEEELRKKVGEFQSAYMSADNEGGIAGLDNTMEFHEITQKPPAIPITQVSFFRENIYRYYGVNEKILNSTYTEAEWNSFYEGVIEPIAIQLSLEFTFKLFTEGERSYGNKVIFTTNRLQYATLQTRNTIAGNLFDRGIITINEYREFMYLPQIDGGDVRMVSLNYVKADEQSEYQIGKKDGAETDPPPDGVAVVKYIKCKLKEGEMND
ncbi:MAG: phage portal protein [Clostridia bacterium]|nr:phage portal protein [Clostridia bacterium]